MAQELEIDATSSQGRFSLVLGKGKSALGTRLK